MFRQSLRLVPKRPLWITNESNLCGLCCVARYRCLTESKEPRKLFYQVSPFIQCSQNYAKSKDIKKDKKKKLKIDENELKEFFDTEKLFAEIKKPIDVFKEELVSHATVRTSAGTIENLRVKFEGKEYHLQDLAIIGKKNPTLYVLDFSAFPQAITAFISSLQKSELNLNPQQDGTKVYLPVPRVTKDHREVMAKKCKLFFSKCKDSIRETQMKYIKRLNNMEKLPSEQKHRLTDQLTALGNKHISMAEDILKSKQEELLKDDGVV